jgi:hypothetical protein
MEAEIMSEFEDYAYKLSWEVNHFRELGLDWNEDIEIVRYEGYDDYLFNKTTEFKHPNPIIYQGCKPIVEHIDYPYPNNSWNVMSRRMYETLISVREFPHRVIPVAMVNSLTFVWRDWFEETTLTRDNAYEIDQAEWYKRSKNLRKEVCFGEYLAVQITEHLNILDREKCVFNKYMTKEMLRKSEEEFEIEPEDRLSDLEMENQHIDEYAFKIPENGLPPIFKIPEAKTTTFVSAEAREAMKKAKITGVEYVSLKGNSSGEIQAWFAGDEYEGKDIRTWIDTKIVLPDNFDEEYEEELALWQGTPMN